MDGSEIQRQAGQKLCYMFPFDETVDFRNVLNINSGRLCSKKRERTGTGSGTNRNSLPSLFDFSISYDQFKKARRSSIHVYIYENKNIQL